MLEEITRSAVEKLKLAVDKDDVDNAVDWSIVVKHLYEAQQKYTIGIYDESEKDQKSIEEEKTENSNDIT